MSHQSELISQDIEQYLKQHENKDLLRFLTCGNVDDGKSTLIGRLLHDSKLIYEDHLDAIKKDSVKSGTQGDEIDLALLVDGLQAEREQGITIDVAYRYFSTEKRKFIIADTPGHEQYTRNMATGASTSDLAIILIDARYGVQTQTRRHSYIAALLGIKHIIVAINKMDLVNYDQKVYQQIEQDYLNFADGLGDRKPADIQFVPISALKGDNIVNRSEFMDWYTQPTLMQLLENVQVNRDTKSSHFRFPVQYVNRPNLDFRGFSGLIASGSVNVGDPIMVVGSNKHSKVAQIVTYDGNLQNAFEGQAVTITLEDEVDISRGDMLVHPNYEPEFGKNIAASLVWMSDEPLIPNKLYDFKVGTKTVPGRIRSIAYGIEVNTLDHYNTDTLVLNNIAQVNVELDSPVAFDPYILSRHTGAFIVIDRLTNVTVGAGMVEHANQSASTLEPVTTLERAARLGQKSVLMAIAPELLNQKDLIERLLLNAGITAIVVNNNVDEQTLNWLQQTGLVILTSKTMANAITLSANNAAQLVEEIISHTKL